MKASEGMARMRRERRLMGLCAWCGKPSKSYRCPPCQAKESKNQAARRERARTRRKKS